MMHRHILSDQYFSGYSDVEVFKALKNIKKGKAIISQTMADSELSLVSLEIAS